MNRYYVLMTEQYGRAVFAEKHLKKGETVCYCEVLPLNEKDTITVNTTDLQHYTFTFDDKRDCLVLGDGEIFNHSDTANVKYELVNLNGRPLMHFSMTKDANRDEQLFIDYNADVSDKSDVLSKYTLNLVG